MIWNVVSNSIHKLHRNSCYRLDRAFRSTLGILYWVGGRKQGKRRGKESRFYIKLDVVHDWMLLPNDSFVSSFTACRKKTILSHNSSSYHIPVSKAREIPSLITPCSMRYAQEQRGDIQLFYKSESPAFLKAPHTGSRQYTQAYSCRHIIRPHFLERRRNWTRLTLGSTISHVFVLPVNSV